MTEHVFLNEAWWLETIRDKKDLVSAGIGRDWLSNMINFDMTDDDDAAQMDKEHREFSESRGASHEATLKRVMDSMSMYEARYEYVTKFAFALPCKEALDFITSLSTNILEVGAGSGFWANHLTRVGADVVATNKAAEEEDEGHNSHGQRIGKYYPVATMTADEAIQAYPDRDVLCVWPSLHGPWLGEAIAHMKPGRLLFYIGEGGGGCTADDNFFEAVYDETRYEKVGRFAMPQFTHMHDDLWVWKKLDPSV